MIYVMSDLHGRYDLYKAMLKKIKLNNDDILYILGDIVDRGEDGIKILLDMMRHSNIIPIIGNHEYMAYSNLKKLNVEITEENYNKYLDQDAIEMFENWVFNGGISTCRGFSKTDAETKEKILDFLGEFDLYEEVEAGGRKFVLVHAGLENFSPGKPLDEYSIIDMVWGQCDYQKQYYPDKYLVTGHTPTHFIDPEYKGKIYMKNNHIAIDCGAVYGGRLGCICLDTLEEFYVE